MIGIDGKEKPIYHEGLEVLFEVGETKGRGVIRGLAFSGAIDIWIVEILDAVGIDTALYPWSCMCFPHTQLTPVSYASRR